MKRLTRMVREVYPAIEPENDGNQAQVCIVGDVVYGMDETVPAEQPCLKCKCQPPGVQCETIQCVKRPGCKAIHKPNKCCPDYQCECDHNGKFYANGEKLETSPGGECKVCYCRGGEVQCAEVSCYIRKDCEAKRVPGTCCPKYDNCPPIEAIPERSSYSTEMILSKPYDQDDPWIVTGLQNSTQINPNPPHDDDIPDENKIPDTHYYEVSTPSYTSLEVEDLQRDSSKITIQEIIPERKEIPITAPPKIIAEPQGTLLIEEADDFSNNSNDLVITDSDAESSEISEVFQQPPPVLRIGDKLLFLKKGEFVPEKDTSTPTSVITLIGAEGLQRGFEESGEVHETKIDTMEFNPHQASSKKTLESADGEYLDSLLVLNTAESEHILSLVKRKNDPTTTELFSLTESTGTTESGIITETNSAISNDVVFHNNSSNNITAGDTQPVTTFKTHDNSSTEVYTERWKITVTDLPSKPYYSTPILNETHETIIETNPEYPPLREILVSNMDDALQRFDIEEKETNKNITYLEPNTKIIPDILDILSNKTVPKNITHKEWLKSNTETLVNLKAYLPEEFLNQPAPTDYEDTGNSDDVFLSTENSPAVTEKVIDILTNETEKVTLVESVPVKNAGSMESLEEIDNDSDESTTSKDSHSPILSDENASVEGDKNQTEADDMVGIKEKPDESRIEKTTPHDVQMIDNVNESNKPTGVKTTDVEILDTTILNKPIIEKSVSPKSNSERADNSPDTHLKIVKRDNVQNYDERDEDTEEENEEKKKDEEIFKQLLEDTSTPNTPRASSATFTKETDPMKRFSASLAQYSLKDAAFDPNFIGLLANFFSNQRTT
ncbi:uncharacterized protein isoform X2 [Leptinotarsa decemlineata]